jgi:DNA primase
MISEKSMQDIRDVSPSVIIGKVVKLKKNSGLCPFHDEKSPSFHVDDRKGIFKCFGCGASGDGIKFVQLYEKISFYEACESIAKTQGISIDYIDNYTPEQRAQHKEKLEVYKEILDYCHSFYKRQLQLNEEVKKSLIDRGIDDEDIEEWQLGFAPDDWQSVVPHIVNKGWHTPALEIGIIGSTDGRNYDVYRNRIIIPLYDRQEQLIGFAGRSLGDAKPKYINPKESEVYVKSDTWFGFFRAAKAMQQANNVYVVEGYFDAISMHKQGVTNTLASCGTETSDGQIRRLKSYTNTISIMYDGDAAGQKKIAKVVQQALKNGLHAQVVELDGVDPDEFCRQ